MSAVTQVVLGAVIGVAEQYPASGQLGFVPPAQPEIGEVLYAIGGVGQGPLADHGRALV